MSNPGSAVVIKQEKDAEPVAGTSGPNASEIEKRIIELCQEFPKGITDKILQNDMPNLDAKIRVSVINKLLSQGRVDLFKQNNELIYRLKDSSGVKVKGGEMDEKLVYKLIEEAGNKGIWARDIRYKSNISLTQLNKILKALEGKKLVKAVTSVSAAKKKVYMLHNIEPDRSITGGAWYSDQDFESEFVDILNQQSHRFLKEKAEAAKALTGGPLMVRNASFVTSKEIWKYISDLGISKVSLSLEDIEVILDTLVYDGKAEKSSALVDKALVKTYRAVETLLASAGIVRIPCGVCPVIHNCGLVGAVQAKTCVYYTEWLQQVGMGGD